MLPSLAAHMATAGDLSKRDGAAYPAAMAPFFETVVGLIWAAWLVSWTVAALWRRRTQTQAPRRAYRLQMVLVVLGFVGVFGQFRRFDTRLWNVTAPLGWAMVALTLAGVAFAWWARIHLGELWSGGVEAKEGHRVVDSGPYAIVRHPIYTGLIAAIAAAAAIRATPLALAGTALFVLGFALKAKVEERFLEAELGGYEVYRRRVPMLVPFAPR